MEQPFDISSPHSKKRPLITGFDAILEKHLKFGLYQVLMLIAMSIVQINTGVPNKIEFSNIKINFYFFRSTCS